MDKKTNLLLFVTVLSLAAFACNFVVPQDGPTLVPIQTFPPTTIIEPTSPPTLDTLPQTEAGVPRVSIEETMVALAAGAAIVVDVRAPNAYELSHVRGAINIPLGEIELNPTGLSLDKEQWIITYCT